MDDNQPKHKWRAPDGSIREYRYISERNCPVCNEWGHEPDRKMGVVQVVGTTIIVECQHCGADERHHTDEFEMRYNPNSELYKLRAPRK